MNGWFWSRAFGPLPSTVTGVTDTKGVRRPGHDRKEEGPDQGQVAVAHGMSSG